jgi:hypothetical protein
VISAANARKRVILTPLAVQSDRPGQTSRFVSPKLSADPLRQLDDDPRRASDMNDSASGRPKPPTAGCGGG